VPASNVLPVEARQAAWRQLWRRLLAPVPDDDDPGPAGPDSDEARLKVEAPAGRSQAPALPRGPPLLNSS
jgi:hypothetical protein